jgi:CRP-like cAMP-binding protein
MTKGDFVTAVDSFNNQVESTETIIALTTCLLWAITKQHFDELTENHLEFSAIRHILTDKYHIQSRLLDAKRKRPPEQFYAYLVKEYPAIVKAPVTTLASFMGINRSTLYDIMPKRPKGK